MTIEQERLTPTQPITRDKLIKIMRETFTEERTDGCYNLLVLGCQEANYCDPEDAEHATLILAADAILAALKSPPIGGEREIGAPIDPPVDVTPLEREFLAAHYERVGNPTLATEIRSVHWRVGFGTSEASFIQAIRDALAIGVSEPTTSGDVGKLCERLRTAARSSSCVQRSMAEAKSLRNSDGEHKDLYMWPAPEQTLEGQAATLLTQMEAREREAKHRFFLEWIAGARPPVHPEPMHGEGWYSSFDRAIQMMRRQSPDAIFVSLTEEVSHRIDRSDDARALLTGAGS